MTHAHNHSTWKVEAGSQDSRATSAAGGAGGQCVLHETLL